MSNKNIGEALTALQKLDALTPTVSFVSEFDIEVPSTESILTTENPPYEQVKKADMLLFNFNLTLLHSLWDKIETIPAAFAMIDKQMKLIETRRAILGLPYGSDKSNSSKVITFEPLP